MMKVPRKTGSNILQKASHPRYTCFVTGTPGPDGPRLRIDPYDAMSTSASSLVVGITSMRLLIITNEFSHRTALTMHRRKYSIVLINPLVASETWKQ